MRLTLKSALTVFIIPVLGLALLAGCGKKGPPLPPLPVKGAQIEDGALRYGELEGKGFVLVGGESFAGKTVFSVTKEAKRQIDKRSL